MQQALNRSYADRDKIVSDLDKLREDLDRSQVGVEEEELIKFAAARGRRLICSGD